MVAYVGIERTLAELEGDVFCIACGAARSARANAALAAGSTTKGLDAALPRLALCAGCGEEQARARRAGLAYRLAMLTAPLVVPLALPYVGVGAWVALALALAWVGIVFASRAWLDRAFGHRFPVVVLGGEGRVVRLAVHGRPLPAPGVRDPYRTPAAPSVPREVPAPRVQGAAPRWPEALLSAAVALVVTFGFWTRSYPHLTFRYADYPTGCEMTFDETDRHPIVAPGELRTRLRHGPHTVAVRCGDGEFPTYPIEMLFGVDVRCDFAGGTGACAADTAAPVTPMAPGSPSRRPWP